MTDDDSSEDAGPAPNREKPPLSGADSVRAPEREDIPDGLLERNQWVCWRTQNRGGKLTKVPIVPGRGQYASSTDPATWRDFETAAAYAESRPKVGVGFVFTDEDSFVGIDLDDCRVPETGTLDETANAIIERLDSYTEVSPSGTGVHVIARGELPDGRNRKDSVELYETGRYFTVTGEHIPHTPEQVAGRTVALEQVHGRYLSDDTALSSDTGGSSAVTSSSNQSDAHPSEAVQSLSDETLLRRAKGAKNGEKFAALWHGSTQGYESHSEADMALCALLAFWTGGDETRIDSLFRGSELYREKWDDVHFSDGSTYGEKTIERAVQGTDEFYDPGESGTVSSLSSEGGVNTKGDPEHGLPTQVIRLTDKVESLEAENHRLRERLAMLREQPSLDAVPTGATVTEDEDVEQIDTADSPDGGVLSRLKRVLAMD